MAWGRRTTALVVLVAAGPLLVGCGRGDATQAEPTPVVIPGSTVTIGTESTAPAPTTPAAPSTTPAPTPSATPTPTEESTASAITVDSADELFALVGEAMGRFETVRLSVGDGTVPVVVEADHQYLGGDDYSAVITAAEPIDVRRVGGTTYVAMAGGAFAEVDPADPATAGSVLGSLTRWDVLGDLVALLQGASGFVAAGAGDVDGTPVERYTFTVDAADVADAAQVPDDVTGPVEVTFAVDDTGLPVRVDQSFVDSDQVVRTDYSAWGVPVEVAAP